MDRATRDALVAKYKDGYMQVASALECATDLELDRRPAPDKWTSREIVHHLADSEMTSAIRLRRLLAEDIPVIVGYDQEELARRLDYHQHPLDTALQTVEAVRANTVSLLRRLQWLQIYADHAHNHAAQIRVARRA